MDDVSTAAFEAALLRPIRFAEKLEEFNVQVDGAWKLKWKNAELERNQELIQLEHSVADWLNQGQADAPLTVSNSHIRNFRNQLKTTRNSKLYYSGIYAKRLTLPDLICTVPLLPCSAPISSSSKSSSFYDDADSGTEEAVFSDGPE